ncbi:MAG: class I SAM-dependent methyltransferase [Pseudomonadota bacterium]
MSAFFTVHSGLSREGPGTAQDVAWAVAAAMVPRSGAICDVGCGPGADIPALSDAVPEGSVTALDRHVPFLAEAVSRGHGRLAKLVEGVLISGQTGLPDPVTLGPFDMIWSAGAAYFEPLPMLLSHWRRALTASGAVALSYPVYFGAPDAASRAFWGGDADVVMTEAELDEVIHQTGWGIVARTRVSDDGWLAYYEALEARCDMLSEISSSALRLAIEEARCEARDWRRVRDKVGYALRVMRPL